MFEITTEETSPVTVMIRIEYGDIVVSMDLTHTQLTELSLAIDEALNV